jgi:hypothetical protein
MLKQDEVSNPDSCLNRAAIDEPVFVLRANDPLAPIMVRSWAERYIASKFGRPSAQQARKYYEALRSASLMEAWTAERDRAKKCPTCESPNPSKHPATAFEGEVIPCKDPWHEQRHASLPAGGYPGHTAECICVKCEHQRAAT